MTGSFQWEEREKVRSGGKGAGKHAAALLAHEAQLAGEAAEEARRNREAWKVAAPAKEVNLAGDFVGEKKVLEFACDASFMQGREEGHLDRHVMVKDLVTASKALKMPLTLEKPVALFSVYDGHFGTKCSEFASQNFHKKLLPRLAKAKNEDQIRESLVEAFSDLDQEFLSKFRTERSGCCAAVALLVGTKLFLAQLGAAAVLWAGDARSLAAAGLEAEEPRLVAAGGQLLEVAPGVRHVAPKDFEQRLKDYRIQMASGLGCSLSPPMTSPFPRALGDRDLKPVVTATPEVQVVNLEGQNGFALYSDGISEVMSPEDVATTLRTMAGQEKGAAGRLAQEAYSRGSEQNLTAIAVYLRFPQRPTPAAPPTPAPREAAKRTVPTTAAELRDVKAARRQQRTEQPVEDAPCPQVLIYAPEEQKLESLLEAAGVLFEDADGDVAHEFLEEDPQGLHLGHCVPYQPLP